MLEARSRELSTNWSMGK